MIRPRVSGSRRNAELSKTNLPFGTSASDYLIRKRPRADCGTRSLISFRRSENCARPRKASGQFPGSSYNAPTTRRRALNRNANRDQLVLIARQRRRPAYPLRHLCCRCPPAASSSLACTARLMICLSASRRSCSTNRSRLRLGDIRRAKPNGHTGNCFSRANAVQRILNDQCVCRKFTGWRIFEMFNLWPFFSAITTTGAHQGKKGVLEPASTCCCFVSISRSP